jgi:hypothetical protein
MHKQIQLQQQQMFNMQQTQAQAYIKGVTQEQILQKQASDFAKLENDLKIAKMSKGSSD